MSGGANSTVSSDVKLGGLTIQNTGYGVAIPIVYGTNRVAPNLIEYTNFKAIAHTTTQQQGGKGGGAGSNSNTTYTYTAAIIMGLCEGPVASFGMLWMDKNTYATPAKKGMTLFAGTYPQAAWSWMQTYNPARAIGYQGIAAAAHANYDLGGQASLGNHTFEVVGFGALQNGYDVNVIDVLADLLNNPNYGAFFSYLGDTTAARNYCQANGIFISPVFNAQKPAHEWLKQLAMIANVGLMWSGGVLKVIPYGDTAASGNGANYVPSVTPIYDLMDDDFQTGQRDPVMVTRKRQADAFNAVAVEYLNRKNFYNIEPAEVRDQANIEAYGLRTMQALKLHEVCVPAVAKLVAQTVLQRELYIRNEYTFQLSWKYCLLEPMDVVTLTDAALGLNKTPVRIKTVEENYDGLLTLTAEEMPLGVAQPALYPHTGGAGFAPNFNTAPGLINDVVVFEAPDLLTAAGLEIWIATSGGVDWGGYEVWVSRDNATYARVGEMSGGARHGVLTAPLAIGADPDTVNSLTVDIAASGGQLIGGTRADADALSTLSYVDGELIAFQSATLTSVGKYTLGTYLRRGAYGTPIAAHKAGARFARLDQAIFKYPFTADLIGQPLYIKLLSFNSFRAATQLLSDVQPLTYTVTGAALNSPLPNVTGLVNSYRSNQTVLTWNAVSDFRTQIDYEIRIGASWATAAVVGVTKLTSLPVAADELYWVAARYTSGQGLVAYSAAPQSLTIGNAVLPANVIVQVDQAATGWAGVMSGGAFFDIAEGNVKLGGSALFSGLTSVAAAPTVEYYGGIAPLGYYQIPTRQEVDIGVAQACNCSCSLTAKSDSPFAAKFSSIPLVSAIQGVAGNYAGKSGIQVEIDTSQNATVWEGWRNFVPGQYVARRFRFRVRLSSSDPTVTAILGSMKFMVDVPDRIDTGTAVAVSTTGLAVAFAKPFLGTPPNVQITILNSVPGDVINFTAAPTLSGFAVQITNAGFGVARSVNWLAKGY